MQKVLISSCLLGQKVRYDGKASLINHPVITQWQNENRIVSFCPEVAAGLPIPRPAVEIIARDTLLLTDSLGTDFTKAFIKGAQLALQKALSCNVKCVILKSKSPSCGRDLVYDGTFNQSLVSGHGLTTDLLLHHGIKVFNEHELSQANAFLLNNF